MTTPFDQLLRESLKPPPQAACGNAAAGADRAEGCLDAETVAAWAEGSLDAAERTALEAHASTCGRCQALLAAMVRIEPVAPAVRPWWRSPAFGWLAPLTVAAAALAIWVRLDRPALQQVAMAPAVVTPPRAESNSPSAQANQPAKELRRSTDAVSKPKAGGREIGRDRPREASELPQQAERLEVQSAPTTPPPPASVVVPSAVSAQPARARPGAAVDALKPPLADTSSASSRQANAPEPAAAPAPTAPATPAPAPITSVSPVTPTGLAESAGAGAVGSRVASFSADQQELVVQTADGATRWRVTSPGTVQRSTDSGVRWDAQPSGERAIVFAGAAPSSTVCWLVGRGGVVLLTTDGRSWRKVAFPRAVDLVAVTAADERTATVTAGDGRRFTTTDGGVNWK
jgi:hypothetical protein